MRYLGVKAETHGFRGNGFNQGDLFVPVEELVHCVFHSHQEILGSEVNLVKLKVKVFVDGCGEYIEAGWIHYTHTLKLNGLITPIH